MKRLLIILSCVAACSASDVTAPDVGVPRTASPTPSVPNTHGLPRSFSMQSRWAIDAINDSALVLNDGDVIFHEDGTYLVWTEYQVWRANPVTGQVVERLHTFRDTVTGTFTFTTANDSIYAAHASDAMGTSTDSAQWPARNHTLVFPRAIGGWTARPLKFPLEYQEYTP